MSVIEIVAFRVLLEQAEAHTVWMLNWVNHMVWLGEINLVFVSNDLTLRLGFQTHFNYIPRLVIEEAMGISQPRDCSEEDLRLLARIISWSTLGCTL